MHNLPSSELSELISKAVCIRSTFPLDLEGDVGTTGGEVGNTGGDVGAAGVSFKVVGDEGTVEGEAAIWDCR